MATIKQIQKMNEEEDRRRFEAARKEYEEGRQKRQGLRLEADMKAIDEIIGAKLSGPHMARARFIYIFSQLLNCPTDGRVSKRALMKKFQVTGRTIQRDIQEFFHRFGLVKRYDGYQPKPKFFLLASRLRQEKPEKYTILKGELSP